MFKKRIASLLLAGVMIASLAVPVFAADDDDDDDDDYNQAIDIEGTYEAMEIAVNVTTDGTVKINPYSIPVDVPYNVDDSKSATFENQQIVSSPMYIRNEGSYDWDVKAKVGIVTVAGGQDKTPMKLGTMAPMATSTAKEAYIYLEAKTAGTLKNMNGQAIDPSTDDAFLDDVMDVCATADGWGVSEKLVLSTTKAAESTKTLVTVKKATVDNSGSATLIKYAPESVAVFRLAGSCTASPKEEWTAEDTFSVNIAFTFSPAKGS